MSLPDKHSLAFTGHGLDRADHVRADPVRLTAALRDDAARQLRLDGLIPLLDTDDHLQWDRFNADDGAERVFLGLRDGAPIFVAVPSGGDPDPSYARAETWKALGRLGHSELAQFGGARSMADWHARHRFCPHCGGGTVLAKGGWQRECVMCGGQHFPRFDPVAIMLVEHDDRILLGRNTRFPQRQYSALAGFVEPGESLEEGVAREILEEAGVKVRDVTYVASQPWPFPNQLMLGCHSHADDDALVIDRTELEDAHWFTRAEIENALAAGDKAEAFIAPPPRTIAHFLMKWWLGR